VGGGKEVKPNCMNNQTNEQYIIELIRQGKTNSEISAIIFKSIPTVKQIVSKLMKKHNCKNRVQLAMRYKDAP
jgi:DNA-binding NarL/FixJ family response regulator